MLISTSRNPSPWRRAPAGRSRPARATREQQVQRLAPPQVAEQLLVLLVVEDDRAVRVQQHDDDRCGVEHRFDACLLLAQLDRQFVLAGDVAVHAEEVADTSSGVEHRGDGQLGEVILALLAAVDEYPGPWPFALDGAPELLVDGFRRRSAGQDGLVLAQYILAAVAGERLKGGVGVEDIGLGIGDGDGHGRLLDGLEVEPRRQRRIGATGHEVEQIDHLVGRTSGRRLQEGREGIDGLVAKFAFSGVVGGILWFAGCGIRGWSRLAAHAGPLFIVVICGVSKPRAYPGLWNAGVFGDSPALPPGPEPATCPQRAADPRHRAGEQRRAGQVPGPVPFMGVSNKLDSALGMGLATTFVLTLAAAASWVLEHLVLTPLDIGFLRILTFILVIAAVVQFTEMAVRKLSPTLYQVLGIFLPLITTNCAVLGVALLNVQEQHGFFESLVYGFGSALGFTLVMVLFAGLRERLAWRRCRRPSPARPSRSSSPGCCRWPSWALRWPGRLPGELNRTIHCRAHARLPAYPMIAAIFILTALGAGPGGAARRRVALSEGGGESASSARSRAVLPGSQCGQCGYPGCAPAAAAVANGEAPVTLCPPGGRALAEDLAALLGVSVDLSAVEDKAPMVAHIHERLCIGCTKCSSAARPTPSSAPTIRSTPCSRTPAPAARSAGRSVPPSASRCARRRQTLCRTGSGPCRPDERSSPAGPGFRSPSAKTA
jgi:electron transport complex protein RnfA